MKYPSEILQALTDKVDRTEDRVLDWLDPLWPRRSDVARLQLQQEALINRYAELYVAYQECKPQQAPMPPINTLPKPLVPVLLKTIHKQRARRKEQLGLTRAQ